MKHALYDRSDAFGGPQRTLCVFVDLTKEGMKCLPYISHCRTFVSL